MRAPIPATPPRRPARRAAAAVALLLVSAACALPRAEPPRAPTPAEQSRAEWPRELALAQAAATRREFALADSVLRVFSARFPGTIESADATFWRALLRLDPTAPRDGERDPLRDAAAGLDAYLAGGPIQPRFVEATTLRRLVSLFDSLRVSAGASRGLPSATGLRDSIKTRDDEIARLTKQLEETTAELERIRRRLAPRRP